ncbi:MAG TPA: hypothetical protein VK479_00645 [Micropepsaceae bacterium]|jgi:hypothetical protein|nr:hypothetical protein [Micropepsaceae bacterium]
MSAASMGRTHTLRASYIGLAVVLTVATALGAAQYGWWRYMTIATHQGTAMGTVLRTNCKSNNDVSYSFAVQGNTLEGRDSWIGCRNLRPGDQLPISFSSRDPAQNMAGDGYARFLSETIAILLASVLGSIVVVVVFVYPFGGRISD